MSESRRFVQVLSTLLAGAVVGAAIIYLPSAEGPAGPPPGAGPAGPPLPEGSQAPPPPAEIPVPTEELPPLPIPEDEDWLDAHLRSAPALWAEQAEAALGDPQRKPFARRMKALAETAPPPSAEVPPPGDVVPFLARELELYLDLQAAKVEAPAIDAHLAPLMLPPSILGASRAVAAEPIR